jgi:thiol-disulfide isomerase/thioredoxin
MRAGAPCVLLTLVVLGCNSGRAPGSSVTNDPERAPTVAKKRALRPEFVRGPTGGAVIAPFVAGEVARTGGADGKVLVYVGAPWCEPCQRFHEAVKAGDLDALLPGVRLVEFDLDVERDALVAAGYASRLIPLFAVPRPDGSSSERRIEGSVKGEAAVQADLAPRLRQLLARR